VRELVLSDDGITLTDVYEAGGEVFMGTMRWEQENRRRDEERRAQTAAHRRRVELERKGAELNARREALERELAVNQIELDETKLVEAERLERESKRHGDLLLQRRADADVSPSNGAASARQHSGRKARRVC
jgi:circadian clock protein KaiC